MATDAQAPNPPRLAADRARRLWLARLSSGWKEPVYVATTANVTLSNVQTIDGVAVPDGARVLVKDQTAGAENGIYVASYGTWLRALDADHADKLGAATKVAVQRGTTNGGTTWRLTTTAAITLGTTALTWAADGGSGGTLAGDVTGAIGSNSIAARAVTYAKMQAVSATARILGRTSSGAGDIEELTAAQTKALLAITSTDLSDFNTAVRSNRLDQMAAPTATVSMGAQFVSNVFAPFFGTDAANKNYVDSTTAAAVAAALTTAFDFKALVRAATTANITLSGAQTIDGVSVVAGDRVLVKNQSTGANNGIYVAAAGAWARASDADASAEVTAGLSVPVTEGTVNGGRVWMLSTPDPITLGTTALTFTRVDTGDLQAASNLSDLLSVSTARTNLGLGTLALASTIVSADITDGTIVNADLADMTTKTYKGRTTAGTGVPEDVSAATLATDLASQSAFSGTYATIAGAVATSNGGKEVISTQATATGATTVNMANGNVHKLTLTGAVTLTFSGATNGSGCSMTLYIAQDATGGRTITWPTVKWAGGVAPVISTAANAIDIYTFFTMDGGTTWFGNQAGKGYA